MDLDCADLWAMEPSGGPGGSLGLEWIEPWVRPHGSWHGEGIEHHPVRLAVRDRRTVGDVVTAGDVGEYVVSPRFVELLENRGFTGWSTYPVEISGRTSELLDDYLGLWFTGRIGPIDDRLTEVVTLAPYVPGAPAMPHHRGFCPEADSWDGSDFVVPAGTRWTCVTGRVRDALLAAGTVGVGFTRMSEMTLPVS